MVQQVPLPENSVAPGTRAAWRRWLERHHGDSKGVWAVASRKAAAGRALSKAAGSWTLLDDVEAMVVPPDLEAALAEHDATAEFARLRRWAS